MQSTHKDKADKWHLIIFPQHKVTKFHPISSPHTSASTL